MAGLYVHEVSAFPAVALLHAWISDTMAIGLSAIVSVISALGYLRVTLDHEPMYLC